uniref:Uncharacterized protein n=1 Tax=Chromera velia CCMP2878 TaxID=1169474 RepID=A0A0G4H9P3_9ALVE|eukprot:Cvel_5962.t1-p1 / transcript=Cvel_5962.t1 / gene=Cvel_5962 / organism=Chromera_velia_CCMP2878 / gene_product=hypothetical protein / transcript_product=hypothetical protein / location=Cvel_scaffold285:87626-89901(+) / protein_length=467 / sequence_SO=supercontig / SO=protein_coding / is_pseudo=false
MLAPRGRTFALLLLFASVVVISFWGIIGYNRETSAQETLSFYAIEWHNGPISDLKNIFEKHLAPRLRMKVVVHEISFATQCTFNNNCAREDDVKVVGRDTGFLLCPHPHKVMKEFFEVYREDPAFLSNDVFICTLPCSTCRIFLPFNRPMIVQHPVTTYAGITVQEEWDRLQAQISMRGRGVVTANNLKHYVEAGTRVGFDYVRPQIESLGDYALVTAGAHWLDANVPSQWNPRRSCKDFDLPGTLIYHPLEDKKLEDDLAAMRERLEQGGCRAATVGEHYGIDNYQTGPKDYVRHPYALIIPWTHSFMTCFENYAMGVPMFLPSVTLLLQYHSSWLESQPERWWFSDWYGFPGVRIFNTWEEGVQMILEGDLRVQSEKERRGQEKRRKRILDDWEEVLRELVLDESGKKKQWKPIDLSKTWEDLMVEEWGFQRSELFQGADTPCLETVKAHGPTFSGTKPLNFEKG